jgi:CheY-like chemotaxis protein/anti-sigma regulatory factor (Ser/Thr protein kinase)
MMLPHTTKADLLVVEDDRALRHALTRVLQDAGFSVVAAADGVEALEQLKLQNFDVLLLDVGLPRLGGLEVLAQARELQPSPRVVMMTADDEPETVLKAVRDQAYAYMMKPFPPAEIVEMVEKALAAPAAALPIEVISARPEWVELLVPCVLDVAERLQSFMMRLDADLPDEVRESVGHAFRELLSNAIEWGGKLDPNQKVRIAFLRARRMLLYRISDPGSGFKLEELRHSAVNNPPDNPFQHTLVREEQGLRPGGFGIFVVREMVDELLYNEKRNEVVFVKYLD